MKKLRQVRYLELYNLDYKEGWDLQTSYHETLKANKRAMKDVEKQYRTPQENKLLLCEHKPVYTLGKSGSMENLLLSDELRQEKSIDFYPINRGGDITYHGPGQITGYPIFDLDEFYHDVRRYVYDVEQVIINVLEGYGIEAGRIDGYTGVWIGNKAPYRKICAIGVHMSRWVTLHGFAFNVSTDLDYFKMIIPCGIVDKDKEVTSLSKELGREVKLKEVMPLVKHQFEKVFDLIYLD